MKLTFVKDYMFSPDGWRVISYKAGDTVETDNERLAEAARADNAVETENKAKRTK